MTSNKQKRQRSDRNSIKTADKPVDPQTERMAGGFDSLGCIPELIKAVTELGWFLPTDVQDEAIPLILGDGDVMVAAETGR